MSVTKPCPDCPDSHKGKISINCPTQVVCPACNRAPYGYELDGQTPCVKCGGTQKVTCDVCGGSGSILIDCHTCHGAGTIEAPY